jgi:fructan beta-fructosidase
MNIEKLGGYSVVLSNESGDKLIFGFDGTKNSYYVDRSKSGVVDFNPQFAKVCYAPRLTEKKGSDVTLIFDASSMEVFADSGLSVMTCVFFPHKPYDLLSIQPGSSVILKKIMLIPLHSIW